MKLLRWCFHWTGQGLKLLIFGGISALCAVCVMFLPFWLLEEYGSKLHGLLSSGEMIDIGIRLILCAIGLSVFTATLADQLKSFPLEGPLPREETDEEKE